VASRRPLSGAAPRRTPSVTSPRAA
jgi:hypothetical protein